MTDEKRRFSRIFFNEKAELLLDGNAYRVDRIANLSVGGCLLEIDGDFTEGTQCKFTILLSRMAPGVDIWGEVVRADKGEVSLKFTTIDPENLFHLQNIIRYNSEDPDRIEEEINIHPGLK